MKLFEYMSVGVPIISSDLPVLREVLEDRKNCLLVSSDDVEAWNETLRLLVSSPEIATTISDKAYEQYLERYTWVGRAQRMVDLVWEEQAEGKV
jgi:glycosyltransferase involved in cell wall biosynthesis